MDFQTREYRAGPAFKALDENDLSFGAEVQRLARGLKLTEHGLARRMEMDPKTIAAALGPKKRGVRLSTALKYAKALDVPEVYIRLLVTNELSEADIPAAVDACALIIDEAAKYMSYGAAGAVRAALLARFKGDTQNARRALYEGYLARLRRSVRDLCSAPQRPADAHPVSRLRAWLETCGINFDQVRGTAPKLTLAALYRSVKPIAAKGDIEALVDFWRATLQRRGQHTTAMEDELKTAVIELAGYYEFPEGATA